MWRRAAELGRQVAALGVEAAVAGIEEGSDHWRGRAEGRAVGEEAGRRGRGDKEGALHPYCHRRRRPGVGEGGGGVRGGREIRWGESNSHGIYSEAISKHV